MYKRQDIVSVKADKITYYNDNYDNGNRKPFLTTYSQSLFSEAAPVTEMDNKPMETSADIYLLENGNQKFSYTPYASGNYQIYDKMCIRDSNAVGGYHEDRRKENRACRRHNIRQSVPGSVDSGKACGTGRRKERLIHGSRKDHKGDA